MEDYTVRLERAPRPSEEREHLRPLHRARRRRWPVLLGALLALAVAVQLERDFFLDLVDRGVDSATEPVRRLQGEDQLRRATDVVGAQWAEDGTHRVTASRLDQLEPALDWEGTLEYRSCLGGTAAVVTAGTARGDVSRLFVRGAKHGDVEGSPGCPASLRDLSPWPEIGY